jgi:hypothetical protein
MFDLPCRSKLSTCWRNDPPLPPSQYLEATWCGRDYHNDRAICVDLPGRIIDNVPRVLLDAPDAFSHDHREAVDMKQIYLIQETAQASQ